MTRPAVLRETTCEHGSGAFEGWRMNRAKVFISYRRATGAETARLIKESLQKRGFNEEDVFLDVDNLGSGPFDTGLLKRIEAATDDVVVLTPGSLDRCKDPDDWLRQEVAHAIRCKKNIVPVMARGFEFPKAGLPKEIRRLSKYNGISYSHEFFDASMDKLVSLLVGDPHANRRRVFLPLVIVTVLSMIVLVWWCYAGPRAQVLSPGPPAKIIVDEGNRLRDAKDYAGAFHAYAQASDRDLNDVDLHRKIEECARRGKLTEPFLDRYRNLVERNPSSAILHNYLGNAFLLLDPNDSDGKALRQYQLALGLDKQFSPPLMNLGIIAFRQGKSDEAQTQFRRYLEVNPQDAVGWTDTGLLYTAGVEKDPNDAQAIDKGLQALDRAIGLDPGLAFAHKGKGRIFAATGRKAEALKAFQRSLALDYEQPDVRRQFQLLARDLRVARPIVGGADSMITRSVREGTKAVPVIQALEQGKFDQAEQASRDALCVDPDNALVWRLLAKALEGQGRSDEAAEASQKASRLASAPEQEP